MILTLPDVLTRAELQQCRQVLDGADWSDGRATAGHLAQKAKHNQQLADDHPACVRLGEVVLQALARQPAFIASALPLKVLPPRFNRYEGGGRYGDHIDSAIFSVPGSSHRVRSDISATLFFSEPQEYDGGELVISDTFGPRQVKLPAGHMVLYPGTSLHHVEPVTRGVRLASFFWVQSLVREDHRRSVLLELDAAIQQLGGELPEHPAVTRLTGVYHNLLREWSNT